MRNDGPVQYNPQSAYVPVDIVIPAKNEQGRLSQTLAALANQDYPSDLLRVYVVDNGSSDDTISIARNHGALVLTHPDGTIGAARNTGIRAGSGHLIGFLDAHCVPKEDWVFSMAAAFADDNIGGCQGPFDYCCDNRLVETLTKSLGFGNRKNLWECTASGRNSKFPWIPSANAMYRREAIEAIGGFDESLTACEDIDLSWRIFLLGYQFAFVETASVTHYNRDTPQGFLTKRFQYGRAGFELYCRFSHTLRRTEPIRFTFLFSDPAKERRTWLYQLLNALVHAGYYYEELLHGLGLKKASGTKLGTQVFDRFRPVFNWQLNLRLRISGDIVYWSNGPEESFIVHVSGQHRYPLAGAEAVIWQHLTRCLSRNETVDTLSSIYSIPPDQAAGDIDDFVDQLLSEQLLVNIEPC